MAAHIMQPAWSRRLRPGIADVEIMPASLSRELMNGLLRDHLGFNGLIVTDATTMAGMEIALPRQQLVPAAIAAGADMFLFVRNLEEDVEAMRRGIDKGIVTPERLEAALTRILALKASLGLHRRPKGKAEDAVNPAASVGAPDHLVKADLVADGSITLVKDVRGTLPIDPARDRRVLFYDLHEGKGFFDSADRGADRLFVELLEAEGFEVTRFVPPDMWSADSPPTSETTERYDLIIYLARLATKSNQTAVRIEWAQPMGSNVPIYVASVPTVFISVENPYHLLDVPRVPVYINTYNSSDRTIRALVEKLLGRSPFRGSSPVDPFCGRWDARL
jgi:beta-N-acetylhexosaminidase